MKLQSITPILNVSNVPQSIEWFEHFGWKTGFTWNDAGMIENAAVGNQAGPAQFAGICCGEAEIFLCKDGQGSRGGPMPRHTMGEDGTGGEWMSWWFKSPAEVDEVFALASTIGATIVSPPADEPWGVRECRIVHPDGHTFRVSAPSRPCD